MSEATLLTTATRGLVVESGEGGLELVLTTESGVLGRLAVSSVDEAWSMVAQEWDDVLSRTPATASVLWDGEELCTVVHVLDRP